MSEPRERIAQSRSGSRRRLLQSGREYDYDDDVSDEDENNGQNLYGKQPNQFFPDFWNSAFHALTMDKSIRNGLIGIAILIILVVIIFLLNLEKIQTTDEYECVDLDAQKTCHSTDPNPYRFYGTKTAYHVVTDKKSNIEIGECKPQIFYLLSRHATRYPDVKDIEKMIKYLPALRENILNSSKNGKAKICKKDLEKLESWTEVLNPDDDNKLSITGEHESAELAQRFKEKFPSLFRDGYSSDKFIIEYTSRERTRSTAEAFTRGLFQNIKNINFDRTNDDVLQFHKECKKLLKKCNDSLDLEELEKFEDSSIINMLTDSISERLGFMVSFDEVDIMYRACSFGYALQTDDAWCSVFSDDELKVLEYEADIDDYYKDGYGNKINAEQACPVVNYIHNLFWSFSNSTESKIVLHFSHAGAVKKIFAIFGLYEDAEPIKADGICSQQDREWRSSVIMPFNANMAFVLLHCNNQKKIAIFHNEKPVVIKGCDSEICPLQNFIDTYQKISEECNINKTCSRRCTN